MHVHSLTAALVILPLASLCLSTACTTKVVQKPEPTPVEPAEAGCVPPVAAEGDDPCTAPLAAGSDRSCTFTIGGVKRNFLIYAPANYDACKPTPLVVDAHGASETAIEHAGLKAFKDWPDGLGSGWRLLADREGFVVVTPQGLKNVWAEDDVPFIMEAEKMAAAVMNVDPKKVYMTGISNGGMLSYWTACSGEEVFQGYAPVSGITTDGCAPRKGVPLIAFNSEKDEVLPYKNGLDAATAWAEASRCKNGPNRSATYGGPDTAPGDVCLESGPKLTPPWKLAPCSTTAAVTTCDTWDDCDNGSKVTFCKVNGETQKVGGHIAYVNDTSLSIAAVTWQFFKEFQSP